MKIISGGQTGADRGGLDFAIAHNLPHGGYCPNGRRAEDGEIPAKYLLQQTTSRNYLVRTEKNVVVSDATVIFKRDDIESPGSSWTVEYCRRHKKPCLLIGEREDPELDARRLAQFLTEHKPQVLNVAGHRESSCPGINAYVIRVFTIVQHLYPLSISS